MSREELSASPSARLITLPSTLIILHITKTSSNNCLLFAIYLDGTVSIFELFWNFSHFIHNNRIIMWGPLFFVHPLYVYRFAARRQSQLENLQKIRHLVDLLLQLPRQPSLFNFSFKSTNYTSYRSKKLINTILAYFFL